MIQPGYYNADCMDALQQMPDKYIDLAILDPPYGINICRSDTIGGGVTAAKSYKQFNDTRIPSAEYFREIKRICKKYIIWGGELFFRLPGRNRMFDYMG